jgi:glycosyltransferase involved in cell wall biosynthesis
MPETEYVFNSDKLNGHSHLLSPENCEGPEMQESSKIPSCGIIIPVYNEEQAIAETIERIKQVICNITDWQFEIICVNDGSSDNTANVLSRVPAIQVLTHKVNRGYGAALRTGLNYCKHEWVFIVDADATYPIEDLGLLLEEVKKGADMVVGARQGLGITLSPFRRFARWVLRKMAYIVTGVMVPDLNSGMRVFHHRLYREFKGLLPMGFSFTTTLTLAALYMNYQTKYIPINYTQRVGHSNIRPFKDFFAFIMLIVRIASYFEPLRFFLPLAFFFMAVGFLKALRDFLLLGAIGDLAATIFLVGVEVFIAGILADVIVRRLMSSHEDAGDRYGR